MFRLFFKLRRYNKNKMKPKFIGPQTYKMLTLNQINSYIIVIKQLKGELFALHVFRYT